MATWSFLFAVRRIVWGTLFFPVTLAAQRDVLPVRNDSIPERRPSAVFVSDFPTSAFILPDTIGLWKVPSVERIEGRSMTMLPLPLLKDELRLPYSVNPSPMFRGDYSTDGVLWHHGRAAVVGAGSQHSLPGAGRVNAALLGFQYQFNRKLAMAVSLNASQLTITHFTGQSFDVTGRLVYQPQERLRFTLFGGTNLNAPARWRTHEYGGTVGFDMSERFGMEVGVQRYYDSFSKRWITVPIAVPYYKFDKFTLGMDVGGLIYHILDNIIHRNETRSGPTIAPPRLGRPMR